jgi:NAD(P)-dependent dehydrogenase (short-subunit alcohol dehydrogenase family)
MPAEQRRGMFEAAAAALPGGRTGQPEDIASLVLALIGNGFITGAVVDVDGGAHIGR